MAAVSPPAFVVVLFVLSGGPLPHGSCFKVREGGVASLSCQYSVKRFGLSRVCWGRSCGTFWCSNILVQTDENGVISKVDDRYRLTGDILDGQMDLDILNVRWTDSGPYCCRVDIDGLFNDKKMIMNLRVVRASSSSLPRTTTAITMMTGAVSKTMVTGASKGVTTAGGWVLPVWRAQFDQNGFSVLSVSLRLCSQLENIAVISARPSEEELHPVSLGLHHSGGLSTISLPSDECSCPLTVPERVVGHHCSFPLHGLQTWYPQRSSEVQLFLL
uniref:Hepatitis A virus cellular receptor 1-like n=1 Tax=Nothobranchius furzeri TaxID=105023 RepID=A0A8C6M6I4_NOTFU